MTERRYKTDEELQATIDQLASHIRNYQAGHDLQEQKIERLRAALEPLADIPLWRDTYPDATIDTTLQAIECITVEHVRAARAALGAHEQSGK